LKAVNAIGFMNLLSSYICDSTIRILAPCESVEKRRAGAHFLLEACGVFGRERLFTSQRLELYAAADLEMSSRLLGLDIATVLGLDPTSERDMGPGLGSATP